MKQVTFLEALAHMEKGGEAAVDDCQFKIVDNKLYVRLPYGEWEPSHSSVTKLLQATWFIPAPKKSVEEFRPKNFLDDLWPQTGAAITAYLEQEYEMKRRNK